MATYGGIVRDIVSELGRADTSLTAVAEQAVLDSITHYERERFWFNEGSTAVTTSASLPTYAYPTDMLEIDSVMMTKSGYRYELDAVQYADLNAWDTGNVYSQPIAYALFGGNFKFYPTPNSTYTVSIDYQKRLPTLSASTDTNGWTTYAELLIRQTAKSLIAAQRFKDPEGATFWKTIADEELERLRAQTERLLGTGRISGGY